MGAVGILMHAHLGLDEVRSQPTLRNLHAQALESDCVVIFDDTLLLHAQHVLPLRARNGDEGRVRFDGSNRKRLL
jgi:hypothetical protein